MGGACAFGTRDDLVFHTDKVEEPEKSLLHGAPAINEKRIRRAQLPISPVLLASLRLSAAVEIFTGGVMEFEACAYSDLD